MSDRTTPETDAFAIKFKTTCGEKYWVPVVFARKLELERDEAIRKLNNLDVTAIHSYHNECQMPICVLRRERDEARESLKHISEYGTDEINAAVELRQKLATALVERDEAREELHDIRLNLGEDAEGYTLTHAVCVLQNERDDAMEDSLEQARLLGMGSEREAKLISERDEAREALAKILKNE